MIEVKRKELDEMIEEKNVLLRERHKIQIEQGAIENKNNQKQTILLKKSIVVQQKMMAVIKEMMDWYITNDPSNLMLRYLAAEFQSESAQLAAQEKVINLLSGNGSEIEAQIAILMSQVWNDITKIVHSHCKDSLDSKENDTKSKLH